MYYGHYDAVVNTPNMENPEYAAWAKARGEDDLASLTLARQLQVCLFCKTRCGDDQFN